MKVYVVQYEMPDDREYRGVSGVYSSQDLANKKVLECEKSDEEKELFYYVTESELDK